MDLFETLATGENALIGTASWVVTQVIAKALPKFADSPWGVRLKPGAPIFWCELMLFAPEMGGDMNVSSKIILGVVLGGTIGWGHKTWKQTFLGDDHRIKSPRLPENAELRATIDKMIEEHNAKTVVTPEQEEKRTVRALAKKLLELTK